MASLKKAIEQKCKDCTYDQAAPGTWREQVELCRVTSCALHPVRPMTSTTINVRRGMAFNDSNMESLLASLPDEEETS